ncbi:hypothetical protein ASG68_08495 [Rhizobium sp. Leaf453]|nr:hypothetical protein ASG68_08495 [Rhizobium sp. Leaf453]
MITNKTAMEVQNIVRAGGSVEVDGGRFTAMELQNIARSLLPGAFLKVHNSDRYTAMELQNTARAKPGQVVLG